MKPVPDADFRRRRPNPQASIVIHIHKARVECGWLIVLVYQQNLWGNINSLSLGVKLISLFTVNGKCLTYPQKSLKLPTYPSYTS
jgi:hypothetical protein